MSTHRSNGTTNNSSSRDPGSSSNTVQPALNENVNIARRRAYRHLAARTSRNDPFFSDELFQGMLNGQPSNEHIGSMYTTSKQQEINEYYRRLLAPRPNSQPQVSAPQTPPPRLRTDTANPADLAVDDISYWNPEWSWFVNDDDAEPLLEAQNPEEYGDRSPPSS